MLWPRVADSPHSLVFLAQHIRKNYQAGTFLVFESDAILGFNFSHWLNKFLTEWQEKDLQVDVVFLGECMGNVVASPQDGTHLYRATKARCSESLVWSYDGIVRFVDYYEKRARSEVPKQDPLFTEPIDFVLENFHNGIEQPGLYWTFPSIVKQGSQHCRGTACSPHTCATTTHILYRQTSTAISPVQA